MAILGIQYCLKPSPHLNEARSFSTVLRRGRAIRTGFRHCRNPVWAASPHLGTPLNPIQTRMQQHRGKAFSVASFECRPSFKITSLSKTSYIHDEENQLLNPSNRYCHFLQNYSFLRHSFKSPFTPTPNQPLSKKRVLYEHSILSIKYRFPRRIFSHLNPQYAGFSHKAPTRILQK